jgi:ABC-type Co2+ transport system permease subunit
MWLVIALGAMISLVSAYFFPVVDPRVHATQVALLATFMGVVIFLVQALDRPFRGDLGLPATPYQIIYEQLMKR